MGIAQSRPLLATAQELRQSDSQAAVAAQTAAERMLANVMPELQNLREAVAKNANKTPPPPPPKDMDEVITRPMGKLVERMVDMMMNRFMPGGGNGQDPNITYETRSEASSPAAGPSPGVIETETRQAEAAS
jgi:hypothetical protein